MGLLPCSSVKDLLIIALLTLYLSSHMLSITQFNPLALTTTTTTTGEVQQQNVVEHGGVSLDSSGVIVEETNKKESLASKAYALENPKPGFSLLEDRGIVAGTCRDAGWEYVFSFDGHDPRTPEWDDQATKSHRSGQGSGALCGYDYDTFYDGVPEGQIMLDIGANMGLSVMPYLVKGWRIVAFEPIPANVATLRRNIFINGISEDRIALMQGVVSDAKNDTVVPIYVPKGRLDNAAVSRSGSTLNVGKKKGVQTYHVKSVMIDRYLEEAVWSDLPKRVALIKIDTQGHELNVLRGMKNFLSNPPQSQDIGGWPFMVVAEYAENLQKAAGHDPEEMLNFMRDLGYQVRCKYDDEKPIVPPQRPDCLDVIFSFGKPIKPVTNKTDEKKNETSQ